MTPAPFRLPSTTGAVLDGLLDLPEPGRFPGPRPAVLLCHGAKGFMEWGFFPHLATLLAERGYAAVRCNLSGDGTHSRELAGVLAVLEAVADGGTLAPGRIDGTRLGLFGHGRGGGNALLAAGRSPWTERVRALVTWAAIAPFDRTAPEPCRRTAPWLIVHGTADETVPADEARRLAAASGAGHPAELLLIPGAGHAFGARHPFAGPNPRLIQALNATQAWFRRFL
jgi:dipeptidyl aminopeptidase/acylaminoacyl peptidase